MKSATKSRHGTLYLAAPLKLQPLAYSVRLAVFSMAAVALTLGTLSVSNLAIAQNAQASPASKRYNIPAGSLESALTAFAKTSGVLLVYPPALVEGLSSPGLQGEFGINDGVTRILQGSSLEIVNNGNGKYTLKKQTTPDSGQLPAVTVLAASESYTQSLQSEGKAADGYRTKTLSSLGVLGNVDLRDTSFSVTVIPQELMQNIQAQSPDDIYKLNPSTRTLTSQGSGWSPIVSIRGFQSSDTAEDGLRRPYNHAAVIEDKERVEVLSGLSGFLFGAAAPGGMINYVYKRPTVERYNSVTVGNYGGGQYYVHGDFGGRFDEAGRIGYRLNVVKQDGSTAIDDQKINRELVSAAVDWQLTDKLLLELNAVYNNYKTQSPSAYWYYDVPHGKAPDASKNWSQPWIHDEFENTKLTGKLSYRMNDQLTLRAAYTRNAIDRPVQDHTMNNVISSTEYLQLRQRAGETKDKFDAAQLAADFSFKTSSVAHKLTVGYYMYSAKSWSTTYAPHTGYLGPYPLSQPTYVPEANFPLNTSIPYYSGKTSNKNFIIGDQITFNEQWSALVGINHSQIATQSFDASGALSEADYKKSRNSPSVSLIYKPIPWLSTYVSYIEGLEMGGRSEITNNNPNTIMPPMVSKQKEIGVKTDLSGMSLNAALFEIEKAYEYTDANNFYVQNGRQNHKGIDFSATGKLTRKLTVLGGVTLLDTSIKGGDNTGKEPMSVAKAIAKVYAEYELPVTGLVATGGVYYTGKQWANDANTDRLPAYTTADLGLRYVSKVSSQPVILRLNVNNVANKSYWANAYYVGAPRSVAFSAQMPF